MAMFKTTSAAARSDSLSHPMLTAPSVAEGESMFAAFVACRTTLEDLSDRTAALGEDVRGSVIAAHLTGRSSVSDAEHNIVAEAINVRLGELSLPAAAPYRDVTSTPGDQANGLSRGSRRSS